MESYRETNAVRQFFLLLLIKMSHLPDTFLSQGHQSYHYPTLTYLFNSVFLEKKNLQDFFLKALKWALAGVAQLVGTLSHRPKRLWVQCSIRTCTQVALVGACMRKQPSQCFPLTSMSLSLSLSSPPFHPSLPFSLKAMKNHPQVRI